MKEDICRHCGVKIVFTESSDKGLPKKWRHELQKNWHYLNCGGGWEYEYQAEPTPKGCLWVKDEKV